MVMMEMQVKTDHSNPSCHLSKDVIPVYMQILHPSHNYESISVTPTYSNLPKNRSHPLPQNVPECNSEICGRKPLERAEALKIHGNNSTLGTFRVRTSFAIVTVHWREDGLKITVRLKWRKMWVFSIVYKLKSKYTNPINLLIWFCSRDSFRRNHVIT